MKRCILVMAVFAAITTFGQTLKKWEAGYLDIHHINPEKRLGRFYKNQAFQKVQKRNVHEKR